MARIFDEYLVGSARAGEPTRLPGFGRRRSSPHPCHLTGSIDNARGAAPTDWIRIDEDQFEFGRCNQAWLNS